LALGLGLKGKKKKEEVSAKSVGGEKKKGEKSR